MRKITSLVIVGLVIVSSFTSSVITITDNAGAQSWQPWPQPLPSKPSAPQNLQASARDGKVILTWSAPSNGSVEYYRIYWGNSPGNLTLLVTIEGVLTYEDIGVTNGQTYYYAVSAVNGVGEGPQSTEVNATPEGGGIPGFELWTMVIATALVIAILSVRRRFTGGR